ncbi:hypothetical protein AB0J80_10340 [Actinoplanes sp. NPDC049548]|uniref:hypothetical protein n=1 Tax=Actinoplanes sp. NPDC049548 TaxID=3155152 RepID=UPI003439C03F
MTVTAGPAPARAATAVRVAAVLLALVAGGLAARVGERAAGTLAPAPDLGAVAAVAYPGTPVSTEPDFFPADDEPAWLRLLNARDDREPTSMISPQGPTTGAVEPYRAQARTAIAAAGWTIGAGIPDGGMAFSATKGGVRFALHADPADGGGISTFVVVERLQPWWVTMVALLCGLAGAWLGWTVTGWAARRAAERGDRTRASVRELTLVALVLLVPLWVRTVLQLAGDAFGTRPVELPVGDLLLALARWPAAVAVLMLTAALVVASRRGIARNG